MEGLAAIIILFTVLSCNNKGPQIVAPPCVDNQVIYFTENEACETGASVREYNFQNEVVYVLIMGFAQRILPMQWLIMIVIQLVIWAV